MKWTNKSDKNMTAELQEDGQVLLIPQGFKVPRASMIMNQWHEVKEEQSLLLKDLNGKKFVFECQTQSELDSIWNICKLTGDAYSWNESNPCFRAWKSDYDFHAPYSLNDKTSYEKKGYAIIPAASFIAANSAPDWEILEFKDIEKGMIHPLENGFYRGFSKETLLGIKKCFIHRVRYKGHEYRVGGDAECEHHKGKQTITGFKLEGNYLMVGYSDEPRGMYNIDTIKPYTPPTFSLRTEDGVNVTDKMHVVWALDNEMTEQEAMTALFADKPYYKYFSSFDARTTYINHNTKTISVADLEKWDKEDHNNADLMGYECYLISKSRVKTHIEK